MMRYWKQSLLWQNKLYFNVSKILIAWRVLTPVLFFLLIVTGCRKNESLTIPPPKENLNIAYIPLTVETKTVREDSIRSDENQVNINMAGNYLDPVFGLVKSSFYTQVLLSSSQGINLGHPDSLLLDSVVLSMKINGFYGSLESQTFTVYELDQNISRDSAYFSSSQFQVKPVEIGKATFTPAPTSTVVIGGETQDAQVRISLSPTFGRRLLDASGTEHFTNNENFLQFFKGIYVTSENISSPGQGAILYFDLLSQFSKITLYYKRQRIMVNTLERPFDRHSQDFVINSEAARVSRFEHDRTGTPVAAQFADTTLGAEKVYVQAMAGVKTKINLPDFRQYFGDKEIIINKAELVMPVHIESAGYAPPDRINAFVIDALGRSIPIIDLVAESSDYYGGFYNQATNEYKLNIGRHINRIIAGTRDYGLYLTPFLPASSANRVILRGGGTESGMHLRIIYTEVQKQN
jgi:hypothetical protein